MPTHKYATRDNLRSVVTALRGEMVTSWDDLDGKPFETETKYSEISVFDLTPFSTNNKTVVSINDETAYYFNFVTDTPLSENASYNISINGSVVANGVSYDPDNIPSYSVGNNNYNYSVPILLDNGLMVCNAEMKYGYPRTKLIVFATTDSSITMESASVAEVDVTSREFISTTYIPIDDSTIKVSNGQLRAVSDSSKADVSDLTSHAGNTTVHVTASERATWNGKADTDVATQSANGLMSSSDKTKLDGIEALTSADIAEILA